MSGFDPEGGLTYGEWLRGKNVQARPGGWTTATHDQRREYRSDKDGQRVKVVTDQAGHDTIQHGRDQQSVHIRNPTVTATVNMTTGEVSQ